MNNKVLLDRKVALLLRLPVRRVSDVTAEFLNQLSLFLGENGGATLHKFGRFNVTIVHQNRKMLLMGGSKLRGRFKKIDLGQQIRVHFSCATPLHKLLKKCHMESSDV